MKQLYRVWWKGKLVGVPPSKEQAAAAIEKIITP